MKTRTKLLCHSLA